jgi:alpha-1,3-mannosyltransferase
VLSKRLHSVFVLRCFNDCFAVFFLFLAIFFFQRRTWTFGAMAYSWGLGIKMSLLLSLPAVIIILFLGRGFWGCLRLIWLMVQVQMAIGVPFFTTNAKGYFGRAFELSRQFKFKWTVNWRMLGEDIFLSRWFAISLLAAHVSVLLLFILKKWLRPLNRPLSALIPPMLRLQAPLNEREETLLSHSISPDFVMTTILSANAIGLLFARSLHYQFYAYVAWTSPYLIWQSSQSPFLVYAVWALQEWAWNVFPSTDTSSAVAVGALAVTVVATYFGGWKEPANAKEAPVSASKKTR